MGKEISWFRSVPKREQVRKEKEYKNRMFPFGDTQQARETEILREILETKLSDTDMLYQLLCVKECLQFPDDEDCAENLAEWRASPLAKRLTAKDRAVFQALAKLEEGCTGLEEFPDAKTVRAEAAKLEYR